MVSTHGAPTLAVLFGHPVGHSLSPIMHDAAFTARGIDGRYQAWDVAPAALAGAVQRMRASDTLLGANVTVPHKETVAQHLDALTPDARRLGAVNTLLREGERLVGHNTDALGLAVALRALRTPPAPGLAVVLGAGGAARAAVAVLLAAGCRVRVHNRTHARAAALVAALRGGGDAEAIDATELRTVVPRADWLVNTTSVGMRGGPPGNPLPDGLLPRSGAVVDLVYRPRPTPLLAAAAAAGLETQDGVPMMVHQGAASFTAWTGQDAPVDAMRAAVERALSAETP